MRNPSNPSEGNPPRVFLAAPMVDRSNLRFAFLLSLTVACLSGCKPDAPTSSTKEAGPPVAVEITLPTHGSITRSITLPGEIKPYQEATLYAKVAGYLKTIPVDKGDRIKAGSVLAEIEVPELLAEQTRYRAEVEVAEIDYNRLDQSQKKAPDLVVPQTVDEARGRLAIAKANLERTAVLLAYAKIVAPFSGIITRRMVDPGAFIPAATSGGGSQAAAIVTLSDFDRVRLQVAVPEMEASLVATGQPVQLTVEGLPGRAFKGNISRFSYALDEASKTMLTEIELPNPSLELRPGMYATVRIGIEQRTNVLLAPIEAVLNEKSGPSVFVLAGEKARKVRVQTGFNDGSQVEILKGLDSEQKVILSGKHTLADGQAVTVSKNQ